MISRYNDTLPLAFAYMMLAVAVIIVVCTVLMILFGWVYYGFSFEGWGQCEFWSCIEGVERPKR